VNFILSVVSFAAFFIGLLTLAFGMATGHTSAAIDAAGAALIVMLVADVQLLQRKLKNV
jgi:uncharacterized membrane protein